MAQSVGRCNHVTALRHIGVFYNLNPTKPIDKGRIKTRRRQAAKRFSGQKLFGSMPDALKLPRRQPARSTGKIARRFYLYKYQSVIAAHDQINLARPGAKPRSHPLKPKRLVVAGNSIFGGPTRHISCKTVHDCPFNPSAI